MRYFLWSILVLNVFMLLFNAFTGRSTWWVSVLGVLFAVAGLHFNAKARRQKAFLEQLRKQMGEGGAL